MGCYWNCECAFDITNDAEGKEIMKWARAKCNGDEDSESDYTVFDMFEDYNLYIDNRNHCLSISYNDHAFYGFGEDFRTLMDAIASHFGLTGEMYISTDEDAGEPPWKTTFESGKLVNWRAKVIYEREED